MKISKICLVVIACVLSGLVWTAALDAQATLRNHWTFDGSLDDGEGGNNAAGAQPPFVTGYDCTANAAARFGAGISEITIDNMGANQLPIDFSIAAWIRLTETGNAGTIFFQGSGIFFGEVTGNVPDAGFVIFGENAAFGIGPADDTFVGSTPLLDGLWHHVVAIRDTSAGMSGESQLSVYVDGVLDAQGITAYDGPVSDTPEFRVGNGLSGDIDDLRVYDGVLTEQQLSDLADDPGKADPTTVFSRELSAGVLPGDASLDVTVTASNMAASPGGVTLTETISGGGLTATSSDDGVVIDNENGTVTITFDSDGAKTYTLTADTAGCGPGSVNISGAAQGACALDPLDSAFSCPGDLVSHYPFDGNVDDVVGGLVGLPGPVQIVDMEEVRPDPVYVAGVRVDDEPGDQAVSFDGTYGVDVQNVAPNDFTIACWIRMDSPQTNFFPDGSLWWQGVAVMQGEVAGIVGDAGLVIVNDLALFGTGDPDGNRDVTLRGTTALADGEWHLLTATRSVGATESTLRLTIDGRLQTEASTVFTGPTDDHPVWGVGLGQNRGLTGDIDDLRIYGRALALQEIQELFTGCDDNASISRALSSAKVGGGESIDVTVNVADIAFTSGAVTLTDTIPAGLTPSSTDDGVTVDGQSVTLEFDADGSKTYTLTADPEGCDTSGLSISGIVERDCVLPPADTTVICTGDLVRHLLLDGTIVDDVSGNTLPLTGSGGPAEFLEDGEGHTGEAGDQALLLDDDYGVRVPNDAPSDFTLSCWVRMTGAQELCCGGSVWFMGTSLFQGEVAGDTDDSGLTVGGPNGEVLASFGIGNPDTTIKGVSPLDDAQWHLVTATRSVNTATGVSDLRLYVDGLLDASGTAPNTGLLNANANWNVGSGQTRGLVGDLDDVRVYARALSDAEVRDLFTAGCGGSVTTLVRALSEGNLGGGDSTIVTITASDVAAGGGSVTLTDTVPAGVTASSSDAGVSVADDQVTIEFDSDGSKTYTVTLGAAGCAPGRVSIRGIVERGCVLRPSHTPIICTGDLAARYTLNGNVDDLVGGGTPIVSGTGEPVFVPGRAGEALSFNNDYGLDIPNSVPNDFTLSCFVRMTAPQDPPCCGGEAFWMGHALFQGETTGQVNDSAVTVLTNVASFGIGNPDTTITGDVALDDGEWHLVTATRRVDFANGRSDLVLYVDAQVDASGSAPNTAPLTANGVWGVGRQAQNRGLVGEIDDVRVYARALTEPEIQELLEGIDEPIFKRGDGDVNGIVNINDPITSLTFQFLGGIVVFCMDALDTDNNGTVNINDPITNLTFQFLGGVLIDPPGTQDCGPDPTDDNLGCEDYPETSCP